MTPSRLIGIAGLIAGLVVGLRAFIAHFGVIPAGDGRWIVAFLLFGVLFAADLRRPRLPLLAAESATALALVLLGCNGYEGILLALVAMQLGTRLQPRGGISWIVLQTLLLGAGVAIQLGPRAAWLLGPPYLGFQLVAFFTFSTMAREVAGRAALAGANAELRAVQEILADTSRMAERLRITHELHDALGHRLTALTLNLEAALQRTQGPAKANVEVAQSLARELLGDVRDIVAASQAPDGVHVAHALHECFDTGIVHDSIRQLVETEGAVEKRRSKQEGAAEARGFFVPGPRPQQREGVQVGLDRFDVPGGDIVLGA